MSAPVSNKSEESLPEIFRRQMEVSKQENRDHWEQALRTSLAALAENPKAANTYLEIAQCHRKLKDFRAAIEILEDGIKRCDFHLSLHVSYIHLLAQCNRTREALAAAHEALQHAPGEVLLKLREATLLPMVYTSREEADAYRLRMVKGISRLSWELRLDTSAEKRSALAAIAGHVNVQVGYQGRNDREFQMQYGKMVHRIMAASYPRWTIPVSVPPVPSGGALRVGYVSSRFRNMSATKYFLGWLREHDPDRFEVHAFHVGDKTDSTTQEVRRACRQFRQLSGSLEEACCAILADQLHVLVFWDVGMDPVISQLAALRLAPVQCAAWDQPITTGIPTVDYFLSGDLAEPADARDHYSERLIRLPGTGTCYQKPVIPTAFLNKTRQDFMLREDAVVYLCCQYVFKYLPEQDDCFVQIAKRVPNSQFVFLTPNEFVSGDFRGRLERAFSEAGLRASDYCVVLPEVERFEYWNLVLLGDVVLDTMEWSGGVSTFEAIACRRPVVTLPGKLMRGRQSYAILTQLGVTETIARDLEDYVAIAARLGSDRRWRDSIVAAMSANSSLLYSDRTCVDELEAFYRRAVQERLAVKDTVPIAAPEANH
jgi:predicted O-linked N-acetylglucosamine transferase (SPINDLY family)